MTSEQTRAEPAVQLRFTSVVMREAQSIFATLGSVEMRDRMISRYEIPSFFICERGSDAAAWPDNGNGFYGLLRVLRFT